MLKVTLPIAALLLAGLGYMLLRTGPLPQSAADRGRQLVEDGACRSCHLVDSGFRAPRLVGLLGKQRRLLDGREVTIDEAYLRRALVEPRADIMEGYQGTMPSFAKVYSPQDIAAIVAYLKTL